MMKILPQYFREKMENWFGKRGISGHVHGFIMREGTNHRKATYLTFIDKCSQDGYSSTCEFENDFKAFMKDFPHIKSLYCRNDNATCYSGSSVLMAKKEVCDKVGMKLLSLDFNEAQKGKDQCDRDGAIVKRCICSFVNSGNDVVNAKDVKLALDHSVGALCNSKSSVIEINQKTENMGAAKIKDISRYHFFEVEEEADEIPTFRAWEFHNVGSGKVISVQEVHFNADFATMRKFQKDFPRNEAFMSSRKKLKKNQIFCIDTDCTEKSVSEEELDQHLISQVKKMFAQKLKECRLDVKEQLASHHVSPESVAETRQHLSSLSGDTKYHVFEDGQQMGWALKKRRKTLSSVTNKLIFWSRSLMMVKSLERRNICQQLAS